MNSQNERGPAVASYPICVVCSSCGSDRYGKVKPDRFIAFSQDRVCEECNTRYIIPTPRWAKITFIGLGLLIVIGCGSSVLLCLSRANVVGALVNAICFLVGIACLFFGIGSLSESVEQPDVAAVASCPNCDLPLSKSEGLRDDCPVCLTRFEISTE